VAAELDRGKVRRPRGKPGNTARWMVPEVVKLIYPQYALYQSSVDRRRNEGHCPNSVLLEKFSGYSFTQLGIDG
jgi:hypothetical protein